MKEEPPLDYKCRDKFLVQTVALEGDHTADEGLSTLWANIEKTSKGSIQEKKIRVTFLPAASATPNGVSHESEEQPPSYTANSPSPQFDSPAPAEKPIAESSGVAGAAAAVRNSIPTSQEDLKAQLQAAQSQIAKLTQELKDPQVRQRKVAEASEKVQQVVQQTSESGGVPLHIAAALCLVSFLIAYLFF
jgi:cobalamin biosynthesis Mg chelatase CobN